jgi:ribosomal protein S1
MDGVISFVDSAGIKLGFRFPPPVVGAVYEGTVSGVLPGSNGYAVAGVFVAILPGIQGLLHFRSAGPYNVQALSVGDRVTVQVTEVSDDGQRKKYRLAGC